MRNMQTLQVSTSKLSTLVDQLIRISQPIIDRSHSCVINDIPQHIELDVDLNMLSALVGGMLNIAITHAKDSCIRVSASLQEDCMVLQLRDYNRFNSYSSIQRFSHIRTLATKLGGSLAVADMRQEEKTIALLLPFSNYAA